MPTRQRDCYTVLGVRRDASADEIKRAYHNAARRLHPDRNVLAGETELFLEVQHAYEVLSSPERRALYDAALPKESASAAPIEYLVQYSRASLVHLTEPQLLYALLVASPSDRGGDMPVTPLNLCLLLDRSTSMQGAKLDLAKAAAIRILRMLRPEDIFSLVVFSDRAEVLLPSSYHPDVNRALGRIQSLQAGGATEIFRGLEAGLTEVRRGLNPDRSNHVIVLTDGHSYGDEQACFELAEEAGRQRISISGFGIGADWNDIFLDALAGRTGGNSTYISDPKEIERLLIDKFKAMAKIIVDDVALERTHTEGVELRSAFRLQPEGGPIELSDVLHLGPILQDAALNVLLEFLVQPPAAQDDRLTLLSGFLKAEIAARPTPYPPIPITMERPIGQAAVGEAPPQSLLNALSRLALYRLQERARQEADAGEYEAATRHLRSLAVQLQAQGQHELSKTTLLEADSLERIQSISAAGGKEIKYGTRALVLPIAEERP